jgi:ubiquinone/menaquinone biosynthesis C-methylase UbiE
MALKHVQDTYEKFGETDPLYAVLTRDEGKGNSWDTDKFFALGKEEINAVLARLEELGIAVTKGTALDFGCGAGRLTQALCDHFDQAVGMDISSSMVATARGFNQHGDRCQYKVNTTPDLAQLDDQSFDFIYTMWVLQHSPPEATTRYIAEFFRILRPGGVAMFHIPCGKRHEPGSLSAKWYSFSHGPLKRFSKRLRGKPPVEMHYTSRSQVEDIIDAAGATLLDARQAGSTRPSRLGLMFTARNAG